jgi:hypothetical protein
VDFAVADALQPSLLQRQFGAVTDSGFFHLFDPEGCDRLANELASILTPGGRYYMHEFAVEFDIPNVPRGVSEEEVRARFTTEKGWRILKLRQAEFLSNVAPPVPAISACIERLPASHT